MCGRRSSVDEAIFTSSSLRASIIMEAICPRIVSSFYASNPGTACIASVNVPQQKKFVMLQPRYSSGQLASHSWGLNSTVSERGCQRWRSGFELCVSAQSPSSSVDETAEVSTSSTGNSTISTSISTSGIQVETRSWKWRDYNIRYQCAGKNGPALVLLHGFGANCDHWRKNIPELATSHRVYAIDLLGYGYSDKPDPRGQAMNTLYTFETWAQQVADFCGEIVNDSAFLICNSVGGIVGLQCAIMQPQTVRGLLLLNISLRMLHIKKQSWIAKPFVNLLQSVLRNTNLGQRFFKSVATFASVKKILCECYHDDSAVTDELVEKILRPGLLPGAADVFLDFICYSGGPLPEEMLPEVKCPVLIGWGDKDPWERLELGRVYGNYSTVEDFIVIPNVGHCPQDEAPQVVNQMVVDFVQLHSTPLREKI